MKPDCVHIHINGSATICGATPTWPDIYMDDLEFITSLPTCQECSTALIDYKDRKTQQRVIEEESFVESQEISELYLSDFKEMVE